MLNIAPLDYERYAALYGPPPAPMVSNAQAADSRRIIEETDPVSSELGRRGSTFNDKIKTSVSLHHEARLAADRNTPGQPLYGPLPVDVPAYFNLSDKFLNATQAQRGITSEKVAELYKHQIESPQGTLRIVA